MRVVLGAGDRELRTFGYLVRWELRKREKTIHVLVGLDNRHVYGDNVSPFGTEIRNICWTAWA